MPLSTDTTWPAFLVSVFDAERQRESREVQDRYYGSYNMLLFHCFDPRTCNFMVTPHSLPSNLPRWETVNFVVHMVTPDHDFPVLMVDVKDDAWINGANTRLKADDQIHKWFDTMLADCPLPRMWGLSLLGTSLRVYVGDVAARIVEPAFTDHPGRNCPLPDNLLEGAWDIDILSEEGFAKMKEIVGDILGNAAALPVAGAWESHLGRTR